MNTGNPGSRSQIGLTASILKYYFLLAALWGGLSSLILLSIPGDPKNAWLFGLSKTRFGLLFVVLFITAMLLGLGILFWRKQNWRQSLAQKLGWLSVEFGYFYPILVLVFGITVLVPYFFMFLNHSLEGFYLRVFPFVLFLTLLTIQTFIALFLIVKANRKDLKIDQSDQPTLRIDPWKVTVILVSITFVFIVSNISNNMIQLAGYAPELTRYTNKLDLDGEVNIPTFFSSLLLLSSGFLMSFIAWVQGRNKPYYWSWISLAVIFVYLAIDESIKIHELLTKPLRDSLQTSGILLYAWVIVAIPVVIALGFIFLPFILHLPQKIKRLFLLAALLYVGGALGFEMIAGSYISQFGIDNPIYLFISTIEETLELTGLIVLIYALLDYIGVNFHGQEFSILRRDTR